jgi:hypothetical protein
MERDQSPQQPNDAEPEEGGGHDQPAEGGRETVDEESAE